MIYQALQAIALLASARIGLATTFWASNDPGNPDPNMACYSRPLSDSYKIVAHPKLPCGSRVLIYNPRTNRSVVAVVGDRGPRHAMVDLSRATANAIGANGYENVLMIPLKRGK